MFYETVTIIKELDSNEFGETHLVKLNGVHGTTSTFGIAEPGGYYEITDEDAEEIINE